MAVWNGTVTTQLGLNLIAKVIAGKTNLAFTKLQTSEGNYTSSNLVGMTSLLNVKQEFNVSNVSVQNATTVLVKGIITNTGLSNQYNLNAIGLFATDPDLGEILFSVTTADTADIMPAKTNTNTTSLIVNILTSVTDSSKVTLTLAQPGLVTTDMLDTALTTYIKNTDNATETTNGILKISTTAQVTAGTDNTTAVSPAKLIDVLKNTYGINKSGFGYVRYADGTQICYGSGTISTINVSTTSAMLNVFPLTFFNIPVVNVVHLGSDPNAGSNVIIDSVAGGHNELIGFKSRNTYPSNTICRYIAIGKWK